MQFLLQEMVGWVHVLVAAGGAVACGLNLGRSRWAGLLMGAFVAETAVGAFYRVAFMLAKSGTLEAASLGSAYLLASCVGVLARAAVVAGVAGALSELRRSETPR